MRTGQLKRHIPRIWLMTDERIDDATLLAAVARLPRGAGIVFRHYGLKPDIRRALFDRVRAITRRRSLQLLLAGDARQALAWHADGWHGRSHHHPPRPFLHSAPAHDVREIRAAERCGADLLFVSPLFPTRSHPGAHTLGRVRFGLLARHSRQPIIALGGMTAQRAKALPIHGWAAIDGLSL